MPFFIRKPAKRKLLKSGKKSKTSTESLFVKKKKSGKLNDQEIESDSSDESIADEAPELLSDDEDRCLTTQEKKLKLAKKYLAAVEDEERRKLDDDDDDNIVGTRVIRKLKDHELEKAGKLKKQIADAVVFDLDNSIILSCKQHKLSVTCLVVSWDSQTLYSSSKDNSIVKWSLQDFRKIDSILFKSKKIGSDDRCTRHNCVINALAVSRDDKYLISGDEKGIINVWLSETLKFERSLEGHKKSITGLAVCRDTNSLYSSSMDGSVKTWNLNELAYMETLFGHQSGVTSIDVLNNDRAVTSGGTDKTLRVWKIQNESQLIYNGHSGNIEIVRKLDEGFFVSCDDNGCLCLWGALKKIPLHVLQNAHGLCSSNAQPNWICALAVYPNSDLIATGSCDGHVRLWKWSQANRTIVSFKTIPVVGYINYLQFTSNGKYLVVAIGKEHRLGRWQCVKEAKNSILLVRLSIPQNT